MRGELVVGDPIVAAARIALLGIDPVRRLDRVRPEIDRRRVAGEAVVRDRVVLPVLDRDRDAVAREAVAGDPAVVAVAAPDAMVVALHDVGDEPVAAERRLDPVGRREREVVAEVEVVVGASLAGVHGVLSGPEEEPVAAVGHGVPRDDVPAALLEHEEAGRVLAAAVPAVRVAAHVVVDAVAHEHVVARAVHADAEPGVEREDVVAHDDAVGARHQQRVHPLLRPVAPDQAAAHVLEMDGRAEAHPLALLVLVVREPVDQALVRDEGEEARLPVVREVVVRERESVRAAREHRHAVAADRRAADGDVPAAVDADRHALRLVGVGARRGPFHPHAAHVHRDPLSTDHHQRRVE